MAFLLKGKKTKTAVNHKYYETDSIQYTFCKIVSEISSFECNPVFMIEVMKIIRNKKFIKNKQFHSTSIL